MRNRETGVVGDVTHVDEVECWLDASHPCKVATLEAVQWPPIGARVRNRKTGDESTVVSIWPGWVAVSGRPNWRPEDCEVIP